jgi:O-antigen ligase
VTKTCKLGLACLTAAALFFRASDPQACDRDHHRAGRDCVEKDAFRWSWRLFAVSGFFASVMAESPLTSMAGLASLLTYIFLYRAVRRVNFQSARASKVLQTLAASGVLVSGLALAQTFCGYAGQLGSRELQAMEADGLAGTLWPGIERASALFNGPTAAGAFLAIAGVIAAVRAMVCSRRRVLFLFALVACFAGVLATFSRGAILGFFSGTAFAWFALGRGRARQLIFFLLASALAWGALLSDNPVRGYLRIGADLASVSPSRFDVWTAAFAIIRRHPLFGIGFYQFHEMSQGVEGFSNTPAHPHNGILKALVEQGPVGAVAYLLFAAIFVKTAWRGVRSALGREHCWILAASGGAGIALFTQELFDAGLVIGGSSIALLFACLLAMQASLASDANAPFIPRLP